MDNDLLQDILQKKVITSDTPEILETRIALNEILLEKDIRPISYYSMTSYNFIKLISEEFIPLILIVFVMLLSVDFVSCESDDGTGKLLYTQPISKTKILFSKIIACTCICIAVLLFPLFLFFIGLGIVKGFGSPEYPVEFYSGNFTLFNSSAMNFENAWIDIQDYIFCLIPFLILIIVTMTAFSIMISTIMNSNTGAICTSITIYIAFYIFGNQLKIFGRLSGLLPFTYSNIANIMNGKAILEYSSINITYLNGVIILSVAAILCYIVSLIIFNKKEMK